MMNDREKKLREWIAKNQIDLRHDLTTGEWSIELITVSSTPLHRLNMKMDLAAELKKVLLTSLNSIRLLMERGISEVGAI